MSIMIDNKDVDLCIAT